MATVITSECINCGACEPECPNNAIYQGGVAWELNGESRPAIGVEHFYIVPEKCTECVGFHEKEACAAVCPVDCCIPDPKIPETEEVLIARARTLHPERTFPADFPSRFRKDRPAAPAPSAAAEPPPAVATTTAPAAPAAAAAPPSAPAAASAPPAMPAETATADVQVPASPPPATETSVEPVLTPTTQAGGTGLAIPPIEEWEVPIQCHRCSGAYTVAFRHFRSGVVFRCPYCDGSYVVQTSIHNLLSRELHKFHEKWTAAFTELQRRRQRELEEFEERQRRELEALNVRLRKASLESKPPGAPKRRAGIFG